MLGRRCWARACLWLLASVWIASPVGAQIGAGALAGDVVDQAGAAVPGATVTVTAVGTSLSRTVVTGQNGGYVCPGPRARLLSRSRRAERIPAVDPRRHSARYRRDGSTGPAAAARRTDRGHHGHGRRAVAPQRNFRARPRRRQQKSGRPAAQWPELHHAREPGAWRGAATAARGSVAAHQRRTAAHERVSVRRDLGVAARAWAGGILSERRRDPGVQDRKQQPARGVRALQWRGRQPDDQIREQRVSGQRLRVLPQRSAERAEFLCLDQPGQTTVSPPSVRRCRRRARSTGSDVLLRRLSGPAADDRTNGHLHGADAAPAPGHIHRSHRRACAGHLRSGHDGGDWAGRGDSQSIPGQHDSRPANRFGRSHAAGAISAADQRRHRKQLPARRERDGRSGSVQPSHRSSICRRTETACSGG